MLVYGYLIISRQWTLLSRDKQWHSRYQTRSTNWDDWSKDWEDSPPRSACLPPSSNTSLLTMEPSILLMAISHIDTRSAIVLVWDISLQGMQCSYMYHISNRNFTVCYFHKWNIYFLSNVEKQSLNFNKYMMKII